MPPTAAALRRDRRRRRATLSRRVRLVRRVAMWTVLAVGLALGLIAVAPAPAHRGGAAVHSSCVISGCSAARSAHDGWVRLGLPTTRGWYPWSGGLSSFAGGRYYDYDGQLPSGAAYYEYDVYPRGMGAARDAYRIVVNRASGATWYSPDHYTDFYLIG